MYIKKLLPKFYFDYFGEEFEKYISCFDEVLGEIYRESVLGFGNRFDELWRVIPWLGVRDKKFMELYVYFPFVRNLVGSKYAFEYVLSCILALDVRYMYSVVRGDYLICSEDINYYVGKPGLVCGGLVEGDRVLSKVVVYEFDEFLYYDENDMLAYRMGKYSFLGNLKKFIGRFLVPFFMEVVYDIFKVILKKLDIFRFRDWFEFRLIFKDFVGVDVFVLIASSFAVVEFRVALVVLSRYVYTGSFLVGVSDLFAMLVISRYFMYRVFVSDLSDVVVGKFSGFMNVIVCANVCTFLNGLVNSVAVSDWQSIV